MHLVPLLVVLLAFFASSAAEFVYPLTPSLVQEADDLELS